LWRATLRGYTLWLAAKYIAPLPQWRSTELPWQQKYKWAVDPTSQKGGSAVPLDAQYYRDAFKNGSAAQMVMYEQDFLCYYNWDTNLTNSDTTTGMTWLKGKVRQGKRSLLARHDRS
jgi:hypothetical protein